jgi:hypothetical protein
MFTCNYSSSVLKKKFLFIYTNTKINVHLIITYATKWRVDKSYGPKYLKLNFSVVIFFTWVIFGISFDFSSVTKQERMAADWNQTFSHLLLHYGFTGCYLFSSMLNFIKFLVTWENNFKLCSPGLVWDQRRLRWTSSQSEEARRRCSAHRRCGL